VTPNGLATLPHLSAALSHFNGHHDAKHLMVLGDLARDACGMEIVELVLVQGFEDLLLHFKSDHWCFRGKTWWQDHSFPL